MEEQYPSGPGQHPAADKKLPHSKGEHTQVQPLALSKGQKRLPCALPLGTLLFNGPSR